MKHLKSIFESDENTIRRQEYFQKYNENNFDEINALQDFIDEVEDRFKEDCQLIISGIAPTIHKLSDLTNLINKNIDKQIPTLQYSLILDADKVGTDDSEFLMNLIESLKKRINETDCKIDQLNLNTQERYQEQFARTIKGKNPENYIGKGHFTNTEYKNSYLIKREKSIRFNISLTNSKNRYSEND